MLYCGGGIITKRRSGGTEEVRRSLQHSGDHDANGLGRFPGNEPAVIAVAGACTAAVANWAVNGEYEKRATFNDPMVKLKNGADLLLAFGVRFDDRVTGKFDEFCKHGTIVHVDIDASELNKNRKAHLPVVGDIKDALTRLNKMIAKRPLNKSTPRGWRRSRNGRRKHRSTIASRQRSRTATT